MRVVVYGGGAVGLGIASCLLKSGAQVAIVDRAHIVRPLRESGLSRTGIFGDYHAQAGAFGAVTSLADLPHGYYDFVLVCTKFFDVARAAEDLAGHSESIGQAAGLVLCQNGWGNAEIFREHFAPERIYNARVITGFHCHRPNEVEITVHAEAIHIGSLFAADLAGVEGLCRLISEGGVPCEPTAEIARDLWAKMLYNCALNPLGAILRVPYGALAEHATTRELMDQIIEEAFNVMTAGGYETHWRKPEDFIEVFYDRLVPSTAQHESSTLQDIVAGRPTEIEALNGAILSLAQKQGRDVPHNRAVYNLIKFAESRS